MSENLNIIMEVDIKQELNFMQSGADNESGDSAPTKRFPFKLRLKPSQRKAKITQDNNTGDDGEEGTVSEKNKTIVENKASSRAAKKKSTAKNESSKKRSSSRNKKSSVAVDQEHETPAEKETEPRNLRRSSRKRKHVDEEHAEVEGTEGGEPSTSSSKQSAAKSRATYSIDPETGEKYYECPVCHKRLKGHLSIHMRTHNNLQPWSCDLCGKKFTQKCNLQSHLLTHKNAEVSSGRRETRTLKTKISKAVKFVGNDEDEEAVLSYPCKNCNLKFPTAVKLSKHLELAHTYRLGQIHICDFCEKVFKRKEYLDVHIKKHTGKIEDFQHQCPRCCRTFLKRENFDNHIKKLDCTERVKENVRYRCAECKQVFETKLGMKRHFINKHRDEKDRRFKCKFCHKAFNLACHLKLHIVKHNGQRPFKCPICLNKFKHKPSVANHLKNVHKITDVKKYMQDTSTICEKAEGINNGETDLISGDLLESESDSNSSEPETVSESDSDSSSENE